MLLLPIIQESLSRDKNVVAAALLGSVASKENDEWSDLDFLLIVQEYTGFNYLDMPIIGQEIHIEAEHRSVHCLYENMQIIDYIFVEAKRLEKNPQILRKFQSKPLEILFSKNSLITSLLQEIHPRPNFSPMDAKAFEEFQLRFWYQARYTLQRIIRNDLLIALHLALELFQTLLVLRMILRDRELGTNYHRTGGEANHYVQELAIKAQKYDAHAILDLIAEIVSEFDNLASELHPEYQSKKVAMLAFIEKVREARFSAG